VVRVWKRCKRLQARHRRTGFPAQPDFGLSCAAPLPHSAKIGLGRESPEYVFGIIRYAVFLQQRDEFLFETHLAMMRLLVADITHDTVE